MTPSTLAATPSVTAPRWGALVVAAPRLWRVQDHRGRILGHLRALIDASGAVTRYRAERFDATRRAFRTIGDFRSAHDAMESLRG